MRFIQSCIVGKPVFFFDDNRWISVSHELEVKQESGSSSITVDKRMDFHEFTMN